MTLEGYNLDKFVSAKKEEVVVFLDLWGRVRNTKLPRSKPLLPLFDAVVNAFDAIEETGRRDGKIEIYIFRDDSLFSSQGDIASVNSFLIIDNGIGFTEKHFQAFQTGDTTFKLQKGGKGVGRFLWLKAFEEVQVISVFFENGSFFERQFSFTLNNEGIVGHKIQQCSDSESNTGSKIILKQMKSDYKKNCPRNREVIAKKLVQHCFSYFLRPECPSVILIDGSERILLNELFQKNTLAASIKSKFQIKGHEFDALHIHLPFRYDSRNKVHYCANGREVYEENLSKIVPALQEPLVDKKGEKFLYEVYVSGEFLDERVNNERTDFDLTDDNSGMLPEEITKKDLRESIAIEVRNYLRSYLEEMEKKSIERVRVYIYDQAPQYRPLLKYGMKYLQNISPGLSDQELDLELHRIKSRMEADLKERGLSFLEKDIKEVEENIENSNLFQDFVEQLNDFVKSELAGYVIRRKLIIELLKKYLGMKKDGKYHLENIIHRLIFPLRTTSDDIDYEKQNLWVIDERLSYHQYLASDLSFRAIEPVGVDGAERPDLIIFNSPFAFTEGDPPFSSIVIIEFKRPFRDDYDDERKNPISQVYGYIKKIREGKAVNREGRPIPIVNKDIPFYCYILCDLTEKIREQAANADLYPTPDGLGFFGYNKTHKCYVEIISYDKLIEDARKRNKILFDKLNLPPKLI
jgi:hypothetical protein